MTSLTVWTDSRPPEASDGITALWQGFLPSDAPAEWHSLPDEVHRQRDDLRTDYLAWLHDVGQSQRAGRGLVDRMAIRPRLSYWWMTIPADFSLEPDSPAYVAVRLLALSKLADSLGVADVHVVTTDRSLRNLLHDWARANGRGFSSSHPERSRPTQHESRLRRLRDAAYRGIPPLAAVRAFMPLVALPRRRRPTPPSSAPRAGVTLVDYLAHLGPGAAADGNFKSNYWGPLVGLLEQSVEPITYLHISADAASTDVVDRDAALIDRFNAASAGPAHDLLHAHTGWGVLARACRDYARVVRMGLMTRKADFDYGVGHNAVPLWGAVRGAFRDQFFGRTALLNCLWLNVFEETITQLPHQRLGIYLLENQPWEMAFIHAWRSAGHGELIGVIHSTAPFWSTRLFKDPRDEWAVEGANPMPWPDQVAVNGPAMHATCATAGYPPDRVVDVEALRFFDLLNSGRTQGGRDVLRVLVFGEYSADAHRHLLKVVEAALDLLDAPVDVTLRPHPASEGSPATLDSRLRIDRHPTAADALDATDVAVCGPLSSVAIEAALRGHPVVLIGDATVFMTSPAEGMAAVTFALTAEDLAQLFAAAIGRSQAVGGAPRAIDTFFLDVSLPRWRRVLRQVR